MAEEVKEEKPVEMVETFDKPVRWKITALINNEPMIWKRSALTMNEAKEILSAQLKEWYGNLPFHIIECEKDKTKTYEEYKAEQS